MLASFKAHNLSKIFQLEAYNSVYKHDFVCISETFFESSAQEGDKNIQQDGYNWLQFAQGGSFNQFKTRWCLYLLQRSSRCLYF